MMEIDFEELNDSKQYDTYFAKIKDIGCGSYGTVMHAIYKLTGKEVAVKIVNKNSPNSMEIQKIKQEVKILKQLSHKNIVTFIDCKESRDKLYIIMEYIKHGTLKELIDKRIEQGKYVDEAEIAIIMKSLLETIQYLHSMEIVHRDIKPENILISNLDDLSTIKIVDFGLSAQYFEINEEYDFCGTLIYMAPEQIEKKFYSKSIDIWSCGIIFYLLLNGQHPLFSKGDTKKSFIQKLKKPQWKFHREISEYLNI
jgi:calcium/calmodulin-dependent protein kinase I